MLYCFLNQKRKKSSMKVINTVSISPWQQQLTIIHYSNQSNEIHRSKSTKVSHQNNRSSMSSGKSPSKDMKNQGSQVINVLRMYHNASRNNINISNNRHRNQKNMMKVSFCNIITKNNGKCCIVLPLIELSKAGLET